MSKRLLPVQRAEVACGNEKGTGGSFCFKVGDERGWLVY